MGVKGTKNMRLQIRLSEDLYNSVVELSDRNKLSKSEVISLILHEHFTQAQETDIKAVNNTDDDLKELINECKKIKMRMGYIDKSNQALLEVANTLLTKYKISSDIFVGTKEYENPLLAAVKDYIDKDISKKKQANDFRKHIVEENL